MKELLHIIDCYDENYRLIEPTNYQYTYERLDEPFYYEDYICDDDEMISESSYDNDSEDDDFIDSICSAVKENGDDVIDIIFDSDKSFGDKIFDIANKVLIDNIFKNNFPIIENFIFG